MDTVAVERGALRGREGGDDLGDGCSLFTGSVGAGGYKEGNGSELEAEFEEGSTAAK